MAPYLPPNQEKKGRPLHFTSNCQWSSQSSQTTKQNNISPLPHLLRNLLNPEVNKLPSVNSIQTLIVTGFADINMYKLGTHSLQIETDYKTDVKPDTITFTHMSGRCQTSTPAWALTEVTWQ